MSNIHVTDVFPRWYEGVGTFTMSPLTMADIYELGRGGEHVTENVQDHTILSALAHAAVWTTMTNEVVRTFNDGDVVFYLNRTSTDSADMWKLVYKEGAGND